MKRKYLIYNKFKKNFFLFLLIFILIFSLFCSCSEKKEVIKETKEQKEEKKEEIVSLSNYEVGDVSFENVPKNIDLNKIKQEIEEFFIKYELIVISKDFDSWVKVLSPKYYETYSNPNFYKEKGLNIYGITDLKSYFFNVVYQSRIKLNNGQPLKIFKVIFHPQNVNKAKIFVRYEDKILTYYFIKIDNQWKIGLKEEYEE